MLPEILGKLGSWIFELRSESSSEILTNYFHKSVEIYESLDVAANFSKKVEAYANLAKFCDAQYQHISNHMKSKDFEEKNELMKRLEQESNSIKKVGASNRDSRTAAIILAGHSAVDQNEVKALNKEKSQYLLKAIEFYGKALSDQNDQSSRDGSYDLRVFRLVSLWFSNMHDDEVNTALEACLKLIPSYKFTRLFYQLCARLVSRPTPEVHSSLFPGLLVSVVTRCAQEHPYHILPIILALANSNADEVEMNQGRGPQAVNDDRTYTAKKILDRLKKKSTFSQIIPKMEMVSIALIKLAYLPQEKANVSKFQIPDSQAIKRIRDFEDIPMTTLDLPVNIYGQYSVGGFVGISRFSSEYSNVGGINAPKKINCLGTDGKWRPQLVKGKDDLRQDAVMQQVFGLMNSLLKRDVSARRRRLQIRTYKVVPLSQRSGILEWCENTLPLKDFLVGQDNQSGAHKRYYPEDYSASKCRELLKSSVNNPKSKLERYEKICQHLRPVMRHFFYENFPEPGILMERRLAYTRSAAASSMVGYILGLGDRHVQNILIDKQTAELIHIDLGIAFEQGKILPTPETVPFRLTRDIVDGFGPSGVEGTFRRCCEVTLNVLRSYKDGIITLLEVLMFDPLYNWSLTPAKAYRLQSGREPDAALKAKWESRLDNAQGNNKMAERVLMRVLQKLNGMEDGYHLSVEGQVNLLIQQARDPSRLSCVFAGWQPYL